MQEEGEADPYPSRPQGHVPESHPYHLQNRVEELLACLRPRIGYRLLQGKEYPFTLLCVMSGDIF